MECKVSISWNNTKTQSHNTFKSVCVFAGLFRSLVPNQSHKRRERWLRWDHYYTMGPLFLAFVTVAPLFSSDHLSVTIWLSFNPVQCTQYHETIIAMSCYWEACLWYHIYSYMDAKCLKNIWSHTILRNGDNVLHKTKCQIWATKSVVSESFTSCMLLHIGWLV